MVGWEDFLKVNGWRSSYGSVDRFLSHYKRKVRSEKTRENACLTLKGLCEFAGMGPEELVALGAGEVSSLVQKFIDSLADRGYSIRYVNVSLAYLKTFFNINGFKGAKALDVERHHQPSRYRKRSEWIPTSEEIYKMAYASGSTRNRALILSAYSSGLRNSTLRALLYGDIREELENGLDVIRVPVYPEMKNVDSGACKGNISYYSFLSQEAVAAIREYITERTREFGGIEDDEPLFASDSRNLAPEDRRRTPIMKKSFSAVVKRAAKNAGIQRWRDVYPHCLRKAFESALRNGGLDIKDQEFLMGHILPGSQDAYYDKTKIEELRRKYARVVFFPHKAFSSEEVRKRQLLDTARLLGFGDDRLKRLEEVLARTKSVDEAITQFCKLGDRETEKDCKAKVVIGEEELIRHVERGWDVIKELNGGRFLLRHI